MGLLINNIDDPLIKVFEISLLTRMYLDKTFSFHISYILLYFWSWVIAKLFQAKNIDLHGKGRRGTEKMMSSGFDTSKRI